MLDRKQLEQLARDTLAVMQLDIQTMNVLGFGAVENTGTAKDSLYFDLDEDGLGFTIFSDGKAKDYILNLEFGQAPGVFPDLTEMESWVLARNIASGKDAKGAAYAIARAIFRDGTLFWQEFGSKGKGSGVLSHSVSDEVLQRNIERIAPNMALQLEGRIIATFA